MSTLEVGHDNLSLVDYQDKLEAIDRALRHPRSPLFFITEKGISVDLDALANEVAERFSASNHYPFENKEGTIYASIHLPTSDKKSAFTDQLERSILQPLRHALEEAIRTAKLPQNTLSRYAQSLLTPITDFSTPTFSSKTAKGLTYTLEKDYQFEKQRLHLKPRKADTNPWLKGHKLAIRVDDIRALDQQIIDGICTYLHLEHAEDEEIEDVKENVQILAQKEKTPFASLRNLILKESLARIQRTARVSYLEYLDQAMGKQLVSNADKVQGRRLLRSLILRLRHISDYIQRQDDGYYQVTYQDTTHNFRDIFSRADAFDALPIFPEIEGSLGESTDYVKGAKTFINGLKLKLNGAVQIHGGNGKSVFEYNLAFLNPTSKEYQQQEREAWSKAAFHERVLKVALLYSFVFMHMDDLTYDPSLGFERDILQTFREKTEQEKIEALKQLHQNIVSEAPEHLKILRTALVDFLDHPSIGPGPLPVSLVLALSDEVLVKDVDAMVMHNTFFQDSVNKNNGKDALKYVAIGRATIGQGALCKLPLTLLFEPMYFYETDDPRETFTMTYDTQDVHVLPIFLAPRESQDEYKEIFKETKRVVLQYRHRPAIPFDSEQAFMYRFTYHLLSYVLLKILADSISSIEKRKLFLPIICLHAQEKAAETSNSKKGDEEFMHVLSKVLAHMLAEDYTANSQGFHLNTVKGQANDFYKLSSALYSLYSALPRLFQLPQVSQSNAEEVPATLSHSLDKLAIIVVSSRKSDFNTKTPDIHQVTVYGEVIGAERLPDQRIRIGTLSTFSVNQLSPHMYEQPTALLAQVKACYAQGYRHFLYVAHAPYSRTLHVSDQASSEDLFFMKQEVIQALRNVGPGTRVYPVFCDRYYVVNQKRKAKKPLAVDSLYIDDIGELAHLAYDQSRRSLIFLNLFSGAVMNTQQVYNGIMSYSTLINVYDNDPSYDQYIWSDVLSENQPGGVKSDLLDFILLLHFSRYEKPREFGFKLDPYTRIIGDTSIGKVAVFPHMNGRVKFNALAFLTLVRAVMEKEAL